MSAPVNFKQDGINELILGNANANIPEDVAGGWDDPLAIREESFELRPRECEQRPHHRAKQLCASGIDIGECTSGVGEVLELVVSPDTRLRTPNNMDN